MSPYGRLLTTYSDGALGVESKIGRPKTNDEAGTSNDEAGTTGWWEMQKISWAGGRTGPKEHLVVYSLGAVALGVIAWLVFRKK